MIFKACYDVKYSSVLTKRRHESQKEQPPEFFSTHPPFEKRFKYLEDLMPIVQNYWTFL